MEEQKSIEITTTKLPVGQPHDSDESDHSESSSSDDDSDFSIPSEFSHASEEEKYEILPLRITTRTWDRVHQRPVPEASQFQTVPGLFDQQRYSSPGRVFLDFLSNDVVTTFCAATNRYAGLLYDNEKRRRSRMRIWTDVGPDEMRAFLGVIFLMGIVKKPGIHNYWSTKWMTSTPGISELFSRERFLMIYRVFDFRDAKIPLSESAKDPLFRIRPLLQTTLTYFRAKYNPKRELTIDECMIAFTGRHRLKQFMPLKPTRYGFKAYLLCEAQSGYVLNWELYTGKDTEEGSALQNTVMRLVEGYEGEEHFIYMDRFYSHPTIFTNLHSKKHIRCCGTVLTNRLGLTETQNTLIKEMKDNEILYFQSNDDLLLVCWKDSKIVTVLTNIHGTGLTEVNRRIKKKKRVQLNTSQGRENVFIPSAIADFTMNMRGVDKFDQFTSYYAFTHKTKRWYIRIAIHLLELALANTYVLYKKSLDNSKAISQHNFRLSAIKELITPWRNQKRLLSTEEKLLKRKNPDDENTLLPPIECQIDQIPDNKKKDCKICSSSGASRHQTKYQCKTCEVPTCVIKCYDMHRMARRKRVKSNQ